MLRGWDEGYAVPSFGVYVHQSARRQGVAAALLNWAIEAANTRGAEQVMLKVYESNASARVVYEKAGFTFTERTADGHQLIGRLRLRSGRD